MKPTRRLTFHAPHAPGAPGQRYVGFMRSAPRKRVVRHSEPEPCRGPARSARCCRFEPLYHRDRHAHDWDWRMRLSTSRAGQRGARPRTMPFTLFPELEGVDVGTDNETPVTEDYKAGNNKFTGKIHQVAPVEVK